MTDSKYLVDTMHADALLNVALSYRDGDTRYALMALISSIIMLSNFSGVTLDITADFVAKMILESEKVEVEVPQCQPN